jgi:hypothetical protein
VARTTPFLAKGWLRPPHTAGMGWPKPSPGLWGWSGHPESHQEKKKKNEMGLCRWGWPDHPQGPGMASATPYDHTQALRGGPATPNGTNQFRFFFLFLVAFGVAGPPPKAWGWLRPPHTGRMGWPKPPLGQKGGGPATPFLGKGVAPATPDFPLLFFFFSFLFFFKN